MFINAEDYRVVIGDAALKVVSQSTPENIATAEAEAIEEISSYYNRENETCTILKRNEQIFSFFASFFLLLFRPLKHHFNAD